MNNPWKQFTRRIPIQSDLEKVFLCFSTSAGLKKWFLRENIFTDANGKQRGEDEITQPGDEYSFLWHGYDDNVTEKGKVISHNNRDHIEFSFTADSVVNVFLKEYKGQTIVELTHSKLPLNDDPKQNLYVQCSTGWVFYLSNLKSILEGGIDLRNRDVDLQGMITA